MLLYSLALRMEKMAGIIQTLNFMTIYAQKKIENLGSEVADLKKKSQVKMIAKKSRIDLFSLIEFKETLKSHFLKYTF